MEVEAWLYCYYNIAPTSHEENREDPRSTERTLCETLSAHNEENRYVVKILSRCCIEEGRDACQGHTAIRKEGES